jgi:hypothetical protein
MTKYELSFKMFWSMLVSFLYQQDSKKRNLYGELKTLIPQLGD